MQTLYLKILQLPCLPFSTLFSLIVKLRRALYHNNWLRSTKLPVPVVSIGNITVGGTGKTPVIRAIAQALVAAGKKPVIISRGYKGNYSGVLTVSDGHTLQATAFEVGDEPVQLANQLAGVPVIVCRNRATGGAAAIKQFNPDILLLDDGMQHLKLQRDLDIVLIDATNPFGNGLTLPCGRLREPLSTLRSAGQILLTKVNQAPDTAAAYRKFDKLGIRDRIYEAPFITDTVTGLKNGESYKAIRLENDKIMAFSGLGNNTSFFTSCKESLKTLTATHPFPDHHQYTSRDIATITAQAEACGATALVTSEKDVTRLTGHSFPLPLYSLNLTMECPEPILHRIMTLL